MAAGEAGAGIYAQFGGGEDVVITHKSALLLAKTVGL